MIAAFVKQVDEGFDPEQNTHKITRNYVLSGGKLLLHVNEGREDWKDEDVTKLKPFKDCLC